MIRIVVFALALCACKKSPDPVVARLDAITAHVERMPREAAPWQTARVGDGFVIGSAVRTGAASHAKLTVGKSGKLDVDANAVVYFTRTPGRDRSDLRVETGVAELETGEETFGVGEATLDPNTHVRIAASPQGTSLVVTVGRATLDDTVIAAGQQITIGPAGKQVAAPPDAGITAPAGQIAIAVRDKPARVTAGGTATELAVGEHLVADGATLDVPAGSTVEVSRGGARAVTTGPSVLRVGDKEALVAVTAGGIALHAETADAIAIVPGGTVTAKQGGDVALDVDAKETAIDAQRGETSVQTPRGTQSLAAGQSALLAKSGEITLVPAPPARSVVTITAGESPTLHDPRAPTPLRVAFDQACPSGGTVEVAKDRAFKKIIARSGGTGAANVLVPAGSFNYRVRCAGGRGASGTLRVAKDSGRTPLPKAAARTTVEMDGREYTILYQNLLPELTLAWKTAPRGAKYTFVVKPGRGADERIASATPTTKLAAGDVREGSYKVWCEADGGRRSEESRIVIDFDNAAQSASIDAVEVSGTTMRIKGTVIESSTVTAHDAAIGLDRHRRFDAELTTREGEDGVGVRIAHPKAGIHYYVMRAGAS
ncbi:MAG TPA: hypothetical protein VFV99_17940 [Kofleriaceae bacterium]|nr:hypothetical protein [Kofleriaceae bacterium]